MRDTVLEFGLPRGTGKQPPAGHGDFLLLSVNAHIYKDYAPSLPKATHVLQHRCDPMISDDAESVSKDFPRASQP